MTDDATPASGQDPKPASGQDPAPGSSGGQDPKPQDAPKDGGQDPKPAGQDPTGLSPEAMRSELERARREAADARTKLKKLEDEKLSESEKRDRDLEEAKTRADKAEADLARRSDDDAIAAAAKTAGAKAGRESAAARLVDRSRIERDGDGKPKNLEALLKDARKDAPELFDEERPTGDGDGGARGTGPTSKTMNDRIRTMAGRGTL